MLAPMASFSYRWIVPATFLFALTACSSDGDETPMGQPTNDAGGGGRSGVCGLPEATPMDECRSPGGCPDESNFGTASCSNCPPEALFQLCASGVCETYDRSGTIDARFVATADAEGAQSYVAMIMDPVMANGRRLTCANLLNDCDVLNENALNVINVQTAEPPTPLERDLVYPALASAHVGTGRIVLIYVVQQRDGEGRILAARLHRESDRNQRRDDSGPGHVGVILSVACKATAAQRAEPAKTGLHHLDRGAASNSKPSASAF